MPWPESGAATPLEGQQHGSHGVGRRPLLREDVQADVPRRVHVRVKGWRSEADGGRGVRVARGEADAELVRVALVRRVLGARDRARPVKEVVAGRES